MDTGRTTSTYHLGDLLVAVRRGRWVLLAFVAVGLLTGGTVAWVSQAVYASQAQVLVRPTGVDSPNVEGGRTKSELNLDTEAQLVRSTEVATLAHDLLASSRTPEELSARVTVEVPPNTAVLTIGFEGDTATEARDGAGAFATAYLKHREDNAREVIDAEITSVDARLAELRGQQADVSARLAGMDARDPQRQTLDGNRDVLKTQIEQLAVHRGDLDNRVANLAAGRVISEAGLPSSASSPVAWLDMAGGGTLGLLAGLGVVVSRERFSRRVRRSADLPERCGVPLLGELPSTVEPRFTDVYGAYGPAGKLFGRLRNELDAALDLPGRGRTDAHLTGDGSGATWAAGGGRVLLIVGVDPGAAATIVTANLAAAFARTDRPTAAVAAHASPYVALPDLLGTPSVPGLAEVITGRADIDDVANRAARHPHLTVIGAGSAARASGWPADTMRQLVGALSQSADLVLVESPPAAGGADAQRLAASADAVLLVVESAHTRLSAIVDLAEQLRRVNTPLLGAVVLPRFRPPSTEHVSVPTVEVDDEPDVGLRFEKTGVEESPTEVIATIPAQQAVEGVEGDAAGAVSMVDGQPCPQR